MRLRVRLWTRVGAALLVLAGMAGQQGRAAGTHPLRVEDGVLTVDGMTVASGVDLRIANLRYLYIAVPGGGTLVVAEKPFAGAQEQKGAFRGNALTLIADGSRVQLSAQNRMRGTHSAFVRVDHSPGANRSSAAVGYGEAAIVPAVWPGSATPGRAGVRSRGRLKRVRAPRTAKLCRPSPHGHELCATVREVVFKP